MRRRVPLAVAVLTAALVLGGALPADAANILLYDNNTNYQRTQGALIQLGLPYTVGGESSFNVLLTDGTPWDLVIVDCPSNVPADPDRWTPLINYIGAGGRAIMSFWDLDNDSGYGDAALPGAFDVLVNYSFNSPQNVYAWDASHPIFTTPYAVTSLTNWNGDWGDNGDALALEAASGAVELGGFTVSPTGGEAAIILGNSGRTIYNGFLFDNTTPPEGTDLIANEITFLLSPQQQVIPEPATLSLLALGGLGLLARRCRKR